MKFQAYGSIPLFLGEAGMGHNHGQCAPQLKLFDVFYCLPPVVGFEVIGKEPVPTVVPCIVGEEITPPVPPLAEGPCDADAPPVTGFEVIDDEAPVLGLEVEEEPQNAPGIAGLEISEDTDD